MQKYKYIWIFSLLILCVSCMRDKNKDCPYIPLHFSYKADGNEEVIGEYMDSAKLFVYNDQEDLVEVKDLTKQDLIDGIHLYIPHGVYHVVCWGNLTDKTELNNHASLSTATINNIDLANHTMKTNSRAYWGAVTFDKYVCRTEDEFVLLELESAHINLDIRLNDYIEREAEVKVHNLMPQYNFSKLASLPSKETYSPQVEVFGDEKMQKALLSVLRFNTKNPIVIEITTQANKDRPLLIPLEKYLAEHYPNLIVENQNEVTIVINAYFDAVHMSFVIPGWESESGSATIK